MENNKIVNDDITYSLDIVGTKFNEFDDVTVGVYKNHRKILKSSFSLSIIS